MASPALSLDTIVDISVMVSPQAPSTPTFNQGLIIGNSGIIPSQTSRVRSYTGANGLLTDGFSTSSPEYIAATLYFSQVPQPIILWVGAQDPAGLNTVVPHSGGGGTGYAVGDILNVVQGGASGGTVSVATVGGSGSVTGVRVNTAGTGYSVANSLATTAATGTGTGCTVDITVIGESALLAAIACRAKTAQWYQYCFAQSLAASDVEALALWTQTAAPASYLFYGTSASNVLNNQAGNVAAFLQAAEYSRVFGIYSTTQSGAAPNNVYAKAAAMGVACGLTTELAGSYFQMMFKTLVGITQEPLTQTQVTTLKGLNINMYVEYANAYTFTQYGVQPDGHYYDETSNLDILVANIQFNVMNVLVGSPAVAQTDAGQTLLLQAVNDAAQLSANIGFIAGGTWQGPQVLNLKHGQSIPQGFLSQSPPYSTQSPANRAARQAMPIYLAVIEAGAVQSVVIGVYVQP